MQLKEPMPIEQRFLTSQAARLLAAAIVVVVQTASVGNAGTQGAAETQAPRQGAPRQQVAAVTPRHVDLRLDVRPHNPTILVEADLTFVTDRWIDSVIVSLGADMDLDVVEDEDGVPLAYRRRRGVVRIATPAIERDTETTWTFRYRARFDRPLEERGQLLLTTPWYPHFERRRDAGEFQRYAPMSMTLTATLPQPWVLVSAGTNATSRNEDERITYTWRDSVPSTQIPLAIGPFLVRDNLSMVGVMRGFFPAAQRSVVEPYVDYMDAAATFFSERIGPLNRRSWNLVAMRLPDNVSGLTVPGVTFVEARNVDPDSTFPYRILAHEIAHHWWNHFIEIPRPRDAWLREGLPTYSALLFLESQYGTPMMRLELERSRRVALAVTTDEALELGFEMETQDAIYAFNYHKAAVVLHMLREVLGLDGFSELCRLLHAYGDDITTDVFTTLAEEVYGDDLSWFFSAWIESAAVPSFDVRYSFREADEATSRYVLSGTITQHDAEIRFPVLMRIPLEAAPPLETTVWIEPGVTDFRILLPSPPRDLQFDPNGDLLYRGVTIEASEPASSLERDARGR